MTSIRSRQQPKEPFRIHHDDLEIEDSEPEQDPDHSICEDDSLEHRHEPDDDTYSETSDEGDVDTTVQVDMDKFQESFRGIKERFRLINRIGEGTFSTVYKAEDLLYDHYDNNWDMDEKENARWTSPPQKKQKRMGSPTLGGVSDYELSSTRRRTKYVAIKKIYVTSSPIRIYNELDLLNDLKGCNSVCPLITAFRHSDQVVAVLPYFRHTDFREYFRKMTVPDMKIYFKSLFTALAAVHKQGILHRDIKPTNFLYDPNKQRGVLVDFGLAEREGTETKPCLCTISAANRRSRISGSVAAIAGPSPGYPKNDSRPSRRANRAGTRGFRAPEVLMKCTDQKCSIDIWSAGVILLTILSRRFPFFNSADDIEAMIEISTIFGTKRMRQAALLHGNLFETNIPTIGNQGFSLEKLILWSTCRSDNVKREDDTPLTIEEKLAVNFLERCLDLDPHKRITAEEALEHDFLSNDMAGGLEEDDVHILL